MLFSISAETIINKLIEILDEREKRFRHVPKGILIEPGSKHEQLMHMCWTAEQRLYDIGDLTGINTTALFYIGCVARRWYKKFDWRYSPSEKSWAELIEFAVNNVYRGWRD